MFCLKMHISAAEKRNPITPLPEFGFARQNHLGNTDIKLLCKVIHIFILTISLCFFC
jgi:hypothetical protein